MVQSDNATEISVDPEEAGAGEDADLRLYPIVALEKEVPILSVDLV